MRRRIAALLLLSALLPASASAAPPAGAAKIGIGAFIANSYQQPSLYDRWAAETGHTPVVLGSYKAWTIPLIDTEQLDAIWQREAVPLVTWEPWGEEGGPVFKLKDIAAGAYDGYIRRSAEAARAWGHPLFIRFAHEMNGGWYPWGRGNYGNTPTLYKAAWRHVVGIFEAVGADNVKWVWCPNENSNGRFPFRQYYPGDRWVDWVGLDGFNWEISEGWHSFDEMFSSSYDSLIELTEKPVMIVETGSWETGGDKAEWVANALERELPRFEHIRALLWWNVDDPRGDLRVDSSPAALAALRRGLEAPIYSANRQDVIETAGPLGAAVPVPIPGGKGISIGSVKRGIHSSYEWVALVVLAASALMLIGVVIGARHRRASTGPGPGPDPGSSGLG